MDFSAPLTVSTFRLPDLVAHCDFPVAYHENGDAIAAESDKWFEDGCRDFNEAKRRRLDALKAGQQAAYCYHDCDDEHLRVACDWLNFFFHLDDVSDGMMTTDTGAWVDTVMNALSFPDAYQPRSAKGKELPEDDEPDVSRLARDFWGRCIQDAAPGMQARFCAGLAGFLESFNKQASARDTGTIPNLKSYIDIRRDNSGMKPCLVFLEYTLRLDLPDFVANDPIIEALNEAVNDFVTWSNDIYSYNKEQSCDHTYNMIPVLMEHNGLELQDAVNLVGKMCCDTIDTFRENKKKIPSWSPEIDRDVARYVRGLEYSISGYLHWSLECERYFGAQAADIKEHRLVNLAPKRFRATVG